VQLKQKGYKYNVLLNNAADKNFYAFTPQIVHSQIIVTDVS